MRPAVTSWVVLIQVAPTSLTAGPQRQLSPWALVKNADAWAIHLSHRISVYGCVWGSLHFNKLPCEADVFQI